jgi:hypothetical protein
MLVALRSTHHVFVSVDRSGTEATKRTLLMPDETKTSRAVTAKKPDLPVFLAIGLFAF